MSGSISFLGISSGQDFNTMIDALVNSRRAAYITPLENWQNDWENKLDTIDTIDTSLASFYSTVRGMDSIDEFMVKEAGSSNEDILTASANSDAISGSYNIEVGSDIKHRLGSQGVDSASYTMDQTETWTINVGSNNFTVNLSSGQTLEQVRAAIEAADTIAGDYLTAEIIDDGSDDNPDRLVLTANTGGDSNLISISNNTSNLYLSTRDPSALIDAVEHESGWSGSGAVSSGGSYLGTTNKIFSFSIEGDNSDTYTLGTDSFDVRWSDGEGNTGTIAVTDSSYSSNLIVSQGVSITFGNASDTLTGGETFTIDVFSPDLQAGQDTGLAKTEKQIHSGFSDSDSTAVTNTDQTFTYTYNGQERSINVSSGTTLTGLMNLINNDTQNSGITASILNDGTGLANAFHLVLSGQNTGAAYQITSLTHTLDNYDSSFDQVQKAQNAMIKADNFPSGSEYIQQTTNQITGVITGLTFNLTGNGSATVTVGTDKDSIIEKVEAFQEGLNNIRYEIQQATRYNSSTGETGTLLGNYAVQIIKSRLDNLVINKAPGFEDPNDPYINFQQIGFYTDVDEGSETQGQLLLNTNDLSNALDDNPDAVAKLFAAHLDGITSDIQISFNSSLDTATAGIYEVEIDLTGSNETGRFKLEDGSWGDWLNLSGTSGNYTLTGMEGPERGIALDINYTSGQASTISTDLWLKNGVITELNNELENLVSSSGPLSTLEKNYDNIIENIEDRISMEEKRLEAFEERLLQRFMRLETYYSRMTQMGNALTSMTQ